MEHAASTEPRASSQSNARTQTLQRVSSARDNLSDTVHEKLDDLICKIFSGFKQISAHPDWGSLLFFIVKEDERLRNLSLEEAVAIVEQEPGIKSLLQAGWESGTFKEIRRLGSS